MPPWVQSSPGGSSSLRVAPSIENSRNSCRLEKSGARMAAVRSWMDVDWFRLYWLACGRGFFINAEARERFFDSPLASLGSLTILAPGSEDPQKPLLFAPGAP